MPPDRDPVAVYLERLGPGSRRTMRGALHVIAGHLTEGRCDAHSLDWTQVRARHSVALRAILVEEYAPTTTNRMFSALRGVLKEAWRLGYITAEDYCRAADVAPVREKPRCPGRSLSRGELRAVFSSCALDPTPAGVRDAAILGVLYGAGLRLVELASLALSDYHPDTLGISVRGGTAGPRICFPPTGCISALTSWIAIRGRAPGPMFCPIHNDQVIQVSAMTDQAIHFILKLRARESGVLPFSMRDLQRTFVGDLLRAGANISDVQKLAGHALIQTTVRYDNRGEATRRKASDMIDVPYH